MCIMYSSFAIYDVNEEVGHGTIYPAPSFDAEDDAAVLKKAMKGMGESKLHISFGYIG